MLEGLYSYGTTSLDRIAFQKELDDISANESAGFRFSLSVLKPWLKEVSEVRELPNINELRKPVKQEPGLVTPFAF